MMRRNITNDGLTISNATSVNATTHTSKTNGRSPYNVGSFLLYTLDLVKFKNQIKIQAVNQILHLY